LSANDDVKVDDDFTIEDLKLTTVEDDSFLDFPDIPIFPDAPQIIPLPMGTVHNPIGKYDVDNASDAWNTNLDDVSKTFVPSFNLRNLIEFHSYTENTTDYVTDRDSLAHALVYLKLESKITDVYQTFAQVIEFRKTQPGYMKLNDPITIEDYYEILMAGDEVNTKLDDLIDMLRTNTISYDYPKYMLLNLISRHYNIFIDVFTEDGKYYDINNTTRPGYRNIGLIQTQKDYFIPLNFKSNANTYADVLD